MSTGMNIHGVLSVKAGSPARCGSGGWVLPLVIRTDDGALTIDLFSEESLEIGQITNTLERLGIEFEPATTE